MKEFLNKSSWILAAAGVILASGGPALADCQADIDKVERAIDNPERNNLDLGTDEKMRELLQNAVKEKREGNEAKCQELIDQAKYIGNVE